MSVRAAEEQRREDAAEHGEGPAGGDDHPAAVLGFAALEQDSGVDAVAQHNQDEGTHKFAQHR